MPGPARSRRFVSVATAVCTLVVFAGAPRACAQAAGAWAEDGWERKIEFGLSLTQGNNDVLSLNSAFTADRAGDYDRLGFLLRGAYGETEEETTTQNLRGEAKYDRDINEIHYWSLLGIAEHDDIRSIEYRVQLGPNLGWHAVQSDPTRLDLEAGAVYIQSVYADDSSDEQDIHWRFAEIFATRFNDRVSLDQLVTWLPQLDNPGDYLVHFEAVLAVAMSEALSLNLRVVNDYDSEPPADAEKNDLAVYASLGWAF